MAALAIRNFRLLLIGSVGSNIGTWMQRLAQDWLVLELTSSPLALGITSGLQFLPSLLVTPFGGVLADRYPKRRIVVATQGAMAVCSTTLAILAITGTVRMWHLFVLVFAFGVASAMDLPARTSLVSDLVDSARLPNAVSLNSISLHLGRLWGPAAAGGLIALLGSGVEGTGWVILVNGISYFGVIVALAMIDPRRMIAHELDASVPTSLRSGVRYLLSRRDLLTVSAVMFVANLAGLNFQVIIAMMARFEFHTGAGEFGLMGTVLAVGSVLGALVAARRVAVGVRQVVRGALIFGLVMAGAAAMPGQLWFTGYLPLCGFFALQLTTAANAYLQINSDSAYRGRVMAIHLASFIGGSAFGAPALGFMAEHGGPRVVILIAGAMTVVAALAAGLALRAGRPSGAAGSVERLDEKESDMLRADFDGRDLREVFGTYPTGVVALCAEVEGTPVGMVASSFVSVSVDPALVGVFMQTESRTFTDLKKADRIGVSVLAREHHDLVGTMSAKNGDRFAGVVTHRDGTSALFVTGAAAWLEAHIHGVNPAGDHLLVLLEVDRLVGFGEVDPLVFHRSELAGVQR